jgi:hypothetical protein
MRDYFLYTMYRSINVIIDSFLYKADFLELE